MASRDARPGETGGGRGGRAAWPVQKADKCRGKLRRWARACAHHASVAGRQAGGNSLGGVGGVPGHHKARQAGVQQQRRHGAGGAVRRRGHGEVAGRHGRVHAICYPDAPDDDAAAAICCSKYRRCGMEGQADGSSGEVGRSAPSRASGSRRCEAAQAAARDTVVRADGRGKENRGRSIGSGVASGTRSVGAAAAAASNRSARGAAAPQPAASPDRGRGGGDCGNVVPSAVV